MDGLIINLLLCLTVIAGLVIGSLVDIRVLYPTGAIYLL